MPEPIAEAWREACWALGVRARSEPLADLIARWSEPHRRYHDLSHLTACLRVFEDHRALASRPGEVLAALLFHDAIYDPTRGDNEARSAELARATLAGAPADALDRIAAMIEATRTHVGTDADTMLVLDVDLSILGADEATYDAFERAIRAEYAHAPEDAFRIGRRAVLERFLARPQIYAHERFRESLEESARANLARAIADLAPVTTSVG